MSGNIADLTNCKWLTECPDWWQNFISYTIPDPDTISDVNAEICQKLLLFSGKVHIERVGDAPAIQQIIFDTKDDFECFKLYWILRGKQQGFKIK